MLFTFGTCSIDCARRELRHDGELVAIEPQVFDVLVYLIEHRDRVVSRDDLLTSVWGGRIVSESTLSSRINSARSAIGDSGEQQQWIRTIARKGVRFVGEVHERPGSAAPDVPKAWPVRTTAAAIAVAAILAAAASLALFGARPNLSRTAAPPAKPIAAGTMPIIAVLPFINQTGDDSQEYFADGVTEEVINALGRFNVLRVIGRTATQRYKKQSPAQGEIASELGANYLVEGSVRRAGQRVRIAAQLTEARAGTVMWTDRYDGELADLFEFQDTIARQIAGTLAANIALVEGRRRRDHPRPDQSAYDLVLRARAIGPALSRTNNRQVRELMSKAIELDPNYAAAHALFAEALRSMALLGWTEFTDRELTRGEAEARKAIALASNEPDGHRALGRILLARGENEQARNALKRAIEINPSDANALAAWGLVQSYSGEIADCIDSLQLAMKLNPMLEPNFVFDLAVCYYLVRRHEDALRIVERGEAHYSDFLMFNALAAAAAAQLGRKEQAARYVEALRPFLPLLDLDRLGSRFKDPAHHAYLREGLTLAGL